MLRHNTAQSDTEARPNDNIFDPELDADITLEEFKSAVFHQKGSSSYGHDNICSEALMSKFDIISPFLLENC